jgi:hypothetical protein
MENSAMLRAFRMLRQRPVLLLLILPIHAVSLLGLAFMPDMSGLMNLDALAESSAYMSFQMNNVAYMLVNSLLSLVSLAGLFVLLPPAMELMADDAAGRETAPGWYTRGMKKHWWKPIAVNMILGCIVGVIALIVYIALLVLAVIVMIPLLGLTSPDFGSAQGMELSGGAVLAVVVVIIFIVLVISAIVTFIQSLFALFLPALADRGFGEAFRLMFSRKGMRMLPRLFGGYLLIGAASTLIVCTFAAGYVLLVGVPEGELGPLVALMDFLKSGAGIFSLLLASVIGIIQYPFQFAVYGMAEK